MEGSKRTTTRFGYICYSTKNKQKKRYNLITESLLLNSTSNRDKFIMTPTRGKNLRPPLQE